MPNTQQQGNNPNPLNEQITEVTDFSKGVQDKTIEFLQQPGELNEGLNVRYDTVGGLKKGIGYVQQGSQLTSTTSTSTSSSTTTTSTSTSSSTSTSTSTSNTTTSTSTTSTSTSTTTS